MRVAVLTPPLLADLRPDQQDTLVQAQEISASLRTLGHQPVPVEYADAETAAALLDRFAVDLVFNLVEDLPGGPERLYEVTELLDDLGIPYTGAGSAALRALADKREMKLRLRLAGLPTASPPAPWERSRRFIVKSAVEHASFGLDAQSVVVGSEAAEALIADRRARFGGAWFAEAYVDGREFNVGLIETREGPQPLPVAEIAFANSEGPRILGYAEKWDVQSRAYADTPRVFPSDEDALCRVLQDLAVATWRCFGLSGYARIDFRVTAEGGPVILEANANPCLAADAGLVAAAAQTGLSQTDVVERIIAAARL